MLKEKVKKLVKDVRNAIRDRAVIYYYIYEALKEEVGKKKAVKIMKDSVYRRGEDHAADYVNSGEPINIASLADKFVKYSPARGKIFHPYIKEITLKTTDLVMGKCPLVEAWRKMGLDNEEVELLCDIANQIDYGKYEKLGYSLKIKETIAKGNLCCLLQVSPKVKKTKK